MKNVIIVILAIGLIFNIVYTSRLTMAQTENTYIWTEDNIYSDYSNIESVTSGPITIGYYDPMRLFPIQKRGVIVEFNKPPAVTDLEKLDISLSVNGLKREGGIDIATKIEQLEQQVNALSAGGK